MGDKEEKPNQTGDEDPMTLGFQYLGDLQEKGLQAQEKSLKVLEELKKLGEEIKTINENLLKAVEAGALVNAKLTKELREFAAKVTSACEDTLAGVRLAREYLEEYKKAKASPAPAPAPSSPSPSAQTTPRPTPWPRIAASARIAARAPRWALTAGRSFT
jgi:hypothetical protein